VWTIRVDVHVLNYDGNVIDAASVAATAALLHFRRPDVSVCGKDFEIHSATERYLINLSHLSILAQLSQNMCTSHCYVENNIQ